MLLGVVASPSVKRRALVLRRVVPSPIDGHFQPTECLKNIRLYQTTNTTASLCKSERPVETKGLTWNLQSRRASSASSFHLQQQRCAVRPSADPFSSGTNSASVEAVSTTWTENSQCVHASLRAFSLNGSGRTATGEMCMRPLVCRGGESSGSPVASYDGTHVSGLSAKYRTARTVFNPATPLIRHHWKQRYRLLLPPHPPSQYHSQRTFLHTSPIAYICTTNRPFQETSATEEKLVTNLPSSVTKELPTIASTMNPPAVGRGKDAYLEVLHINDDLASDEERSVKDEEVFQKWAHKPQNQTIMSHLTPPNSPKSARPTLLQQQQLQLQKEKQQLEQATQQQQRQQLNNTDTPQPLQGKDIPIVKGAVDEFNFGIQGYILGVAELCQPKEIYICDGTKKEYDSLCQQMVQSGMMIKLSDKLYPNSYLARTDPADVARVERKTFITTHRKRQTVPYQKPGVVNQLNQWLAPRDAEIALNDRFPGCMAGRTMYVIPYAMGPIGGPITKYAIEITDSPYVVVNMHIMTRVGDRVKDMLRSIGPSDFVKCLHSVGQPLPMPKPPVNHWPCNPDMTLILHVPERNEVASFGSGYGGNSLLGKKCFALRLGSIIAQREGWLAEHMLIMKFTNPKGESKYIAAAFPSACGKTNLAMMRPTLPGYKCECVGDDIAWMKFDEHGVLRAINPERGFFGVAPGTSSKTNPVALDMVKRDTIFANVALLPEEGGVWWEGLEADVPLTTKSSKDGKPKSVIDWVGKPWTTDSHLPAAHPNSRFCTPVEQCSMLDASWDDPRGVPISAILFGGRRPKGVPLVFEPFSWKHGVLVAALIQSEATAAAEHKGDKVMHDPFSMRPFLGYNFGNYMQHWLSFADRPGLKLPKIFHVNWFRRGQADNKFLWPGFGENSRVLDWICRRIDGKEENIAVKTPIGYVPTPTSIRTDGLDKPVDFDELLSVPKDFWLDEVKENSTYLEEQVGEDIPQDIRSELSLLRQRIEALPSTTEQQRK